MKKIMGGGIVSLFSFLMVPLIFIMMISSSLSQTTSGIMENSDGEKQSFFNLYYREPILNVQNETNVLVPFGWLYGAMWYNDPDNISQDKVTDMIQYAYTCNDGCKLVTLDEYIANIKPHLFRQDVTTDELKRNIQLFDDAGKVYFGDLPKKISDYKGLEMSLPLPKEVFYIHSRYGLYDPFNTGKWEMHRGTDLTPHDGLEGHVLYSMIDGIVSSKGSNDNTGWGNWIVVQSSVHPEFSIRFAHMQAPTTLTIGQEVKMSQAVGILGNTGKSSGAHVHVEFMENGERFNAELVYRFE